MYPNNPRVTTRPCLMRIPEACAYLGIGRTKLYALASRRLIEIKKIDGASRVVTESLDRYADSLPSNISGGECAS
jgi:excisionase family DNA binding protein